MFSKKILETDDFLSQSKSAQCLYIHLCMNADDEGFMNNIRTVMALCDCTQEDFDELIRNGYVLIVIGNIYVIRHWHILNSVPKDRYHSTIIVDWKRYLDLQDGVYNPKGKML